MAKKEELHELVRSLTKSEKRYFRIYCTRESGDSNYLRLFDAVDSQNVFDENKIKQKFKREKFTSQLHVIKNYLRKLILKVLRNYHSDVSKDAELKDALRNVEILFNKELYQLCRAELKRAHTLAARHELLTGIVEAEAWKRKLEQALQPNAYTLFTQALNAQKEAIDLLQSGTDYWKLAVEVTSGLSVKNGKLPRRNNLLMDPASAKTIEAKVLFYNTNYLLELRKNNYASAEKLLRDLIALLEKHRERITEEPGLYVSSINNLLSFYVFNDRHSDALNLVQKAKAIYDTWKITASNRTLLKQILRTYNIELEIYRSLKSFEEKSDFIKSTEEFVKKNVQKIPKDYLVSFWFQLASIQFMRRNYKEALKWINQLLNARFRRVRTDLHVHTQLLNLMVHLEQKNFMVLRYYVDSTRRYIKKVKEIEPHEEALLRFFVKIGKAPASGYKSIFSELKATLFPESISPLVPESAMGYIDYKYWLERK